MNETLQDIANIFYDHPVCYLSVLDLKVVEVLRDAGYVKIRDGHVRRPSAVV